MTVAILTITGFIVFRNQNTLALWNTQIPVGAGTIESGDFSLGISVDGGQTINDSETIPATTFSNMSLGETRGLTFSVMNNNDLAVRLAASINQSLADTAGITVRITVNSCPASVTDTGTILSSTSSTILNTLPGSSLVSFCLKVTVASDAPSSVEGTSNAIDLAIEGAQK